MNKFVYFSFLVTLTCGWLNVNVMLNFAPFCVTHHTGNLTRISMVLIEGNFGMFFALIGLIAAFIIGAATAAFVKPKYNSDFSERQGVCYVIGSIILFIISILLLKNYALLAYSSFFAGYQNGFMTQYKLRVSHMSGVAADAGIELGHFFKELTTVEDAEKSRRMSHIRSHGLKMAYLALFGLGALIGAVFGLFMPLLLNFSLLSAFNVVLGVYFVKICPELRSVKSRE